MVKRIKKNGSEYFQCEECKYLYQARGWAEKCEDWCKEHHSCNIEFTKHSIKT